MANIFKAKTLVGRTGIFSHEAIAPNLVYNTGYQNIDGLKDFTTRPTVNTIPVLLSGEVSTTLSGVLYSAQINIKNNNGSTIYKGQPVYVSSAAGTNILVKLASNSGEQTSSKTLGLVYQTSLAQNAQGTIVTEGLLQGFNTNAGEEGDPIWLGPTGSLIFGLANKPYAPNHLVYLGVLTRKHANQGEVFVKIQNGFELEELHNVNINHRNALADKNIIRYDSLSGIWFNDTIDSVLPNSIVYTTGDQTISGIKTFANNIQVSGTGIFNAIDLNNIDTLSLSGVNISIVDGAISLTNRPNVNGTGVVLSGELNSTGIFLNNKINSLSGYVNSQDLIFSGQIASTGSNLTNSINSLSGASVLLYGNQTISGIKTFAENTVFGDPSQGDFLVISGNTFTIYGSGNFTNGLFVSGVPVLTGLPNWYATSTDLALTGSILNNKINNLSGYINSTDSNILFTTGNQTIAGNKSFTASSILTIRTISGFKGTSPLSLNLIAANDNSFSPTVNLAGDISLTPGTGVVAGASTYGAINLNGNINANKSISNSNFRNINIYKTGIQLGVPAFFAGLTIDNNDISLNDPGFGGMGFGLYISGVGVTPALYAASTNLDSTGSILDNKINNLSGVSVLTFGNQKISGTKNFADTGVFGASNFNYIPLTSNPLSVVGSGNTFVQLNIQNLAIGDAASSDLVLTSNAGTDDSFYLDLGINNSGYNQAAYNIGSSGDGYLYVHGGNLTIGTQSPNRTIKFHTDGTTSVNQIAEINSTGYFSPNKAVIALSGFFGRNNRFVGTDITMAGGESNIVSGNLSQIVGGLNNSITGCFSNINGGCFNVIHGNVNTIGGGVRNAIGGCCSVANIYFTRTVCNFIGGGSGNCISPNQCSNFIGGGTDNRIISPIAQFVQSNHNSILGGASNCMSSSAGCSSILGGFCNNISSCMNTIVGGCCNQLSHPSSIIAYGACNSGVAQQLAPGIFIGGINNRIETSVTSAIFGGCDNKINGNCSSIVGGHSNTIGICDIAGTRLSYSSFIGGGGFNIITGTLGNCTTISEYSLIVGGYANKITSCFGSILGGRQNLVRHVGATVIGDGGARDKISRGVCSLSLDFNGGIFLTGSNITLSPSPLPGRVDFCDSNLINATPQILTVRDNFNITSAYNSRMILVNSTATPITGFLISGQSTGFNASLIQIGAGQIQITGSGIGVTFNSYNNQYKSAGIYSTISVLHTGNNGYIMYGNTA